MTHPYDPATLPTHSGAWYVYIRRDGNKRTGLLAGPYAYGADAARHVDACRTMACQIDPWADFDHFGVCEVTDSSVERVGVLNARLAMAVTV